MTWRPNGLTVATGCGGIGGFELGFQRAGFRVLWTMENAKFPSKVYAKRFPSVTNYGDIYRWLEHRLVRPNVFAFGFPCTNISGAQNGDRLMLAGDESKVLYALADIANELLPEWVVIENVTRVKLILHQIYDAMPHWIFEHADLTASDFGVPTRRTRTFIVGHPRAECARQVLSAPRAAASAFQTGGSADVLPMCLPWKGGPSLERLGSCVITGTQADAAGIRAGDGLPRRVDGPRYLALGNAVCPPIAEWLGRRIMEQI